MKEISLKDDLVKIKSRLMALKADIKETSKSINIREMKAARMQNTLNQIVTDSNNELISLNIGGKLFTTTRRTLNSSQNSLLKAIVESGRFNLTKPIFIERSAKMFNHILDFLRKGKINYNKFSKVELKALMEEALYYQIEELSDYLEEQLMEVEFINFTFSGGYEYKNKTAGTNLLLDINDSSCMKGICANSPGWIIIELNKVWEFDLIEIGGWRGDSQLWYADNGAGASISTSLDNNKWLKVGVIPTGYGTEIKQVSLSRSKARYIKFHFSSYLGIGYLNVIRKEFS